MSLITSFVIKYNIKYLGRDILISASIKLISYKNILIVYWKIIDFKYRMTIKWQLKSWCFWQISDSLSSSHRATLISISCWNFNFKSSFNHLQWIWRLYTQKGKNRYFSQEKSIPIYPSLCVKDAKFCY